MELLLAELKTKIEYQIAWLLYTIGVRSHKRLPALKELYAKAMAAKWCSKKDRKFCEAAFMRLYSYDIAKYLRQGEAAFILSLALYDVERGDHRLTTVVNYVERGVMPTEIAVFTNKIDIDSLVPTLAGIIKALGETSPELLASTWHIMATRTRLLPPLEKVLDNAVILGVLAEMEKKGYVMRDGNRYVLTEEGKLVARDVELPQDVARLKQLKYVTPAFFAILNTPVENL
ncbi:hypothetical protein [Pyrobaculum neutrophilum]|uniref:Uncharacterized protein n=1 Tax=Pyrobaculum neutrophilum (strain DSM 2338 / JCM 9278 / NBRC 100436 / V24Sta) TaxID=444157 RepID=B1YCU1_PYRNV|nr:hypothetical protein [Pyrobaculum neutrophilum]ACB39604.1 conserved hypothetical protein [Pyrobaculum neutrophilum V24Sta]